VYEFTIDMVNYLNQTIQVKMIILILVWDNYSPKRKNRCSSKFR
jgi:hypothetical protein